MEKKSLQIRIADLGIRIFYRYEYMKSQCQEWLDISGAAANIEVEASEDEIEKEYRAFPKGTVTRELCESVCIYREIAKRLIRYSAFVMHGAVVELDGKAYVFAAKSGVGKTTHTKLWLECFPGRASYINGDKPILRYREGQWYAYGTPWMGKENFGAPKSAPVRAICFLERGKGNEIHKIQDREVVNRLFHQLYLPNAKESMLRFMDLVDEMVRAIPFYVLQCTISEEAVKTAYEGMTGDGDANAGSTENQ